MKLGSYIAIVLLGLTAGCISKSAYLALETDHTRVKNDSLLLEKRIRQLNDENIRLASESAKMEQAMNNRLQEKQDSLNYKEQLIRDRELSLKDMKALKEEEREAYMILSRQILGDFSDYDKQTLTTTTGCTQITVSINDKKLFTPGTARIESMATEMNQKAWAVLNKYPDVQLSIVSYADSLPVVSKDKNPDAYQLAYAKANVLYRDLNNQSKTLKVRTAMGIRSEQNIKTYPSQIDYIFYSNLLPCIHTK